MKIKNALFLLLIIAMMACKSTADVDLSKVDFAEPPTIIYQMKQDYTKLVPVQLNEEKTAVIAYPAPKDLFNQEGKLRFPLPLDHDFYLDEIGVGLNTAFISLSIEDYSHMLMPPAIDSLFKLIVDKDPFTKMYNLGNRKQYLDKELVKELVSSGKYKGYKKLK